MEISNNMQAKYPKKQPTRNWDPLRKEYPVRKFPETEQTSVAIGHAWLRAPELLKELKNPLACIKEYYHDYDIEKSQMRSQSTLDFGPKNPDTNRYNKHTSCTENLYIYPPSRRLADRPPQCGVHGTTEMKSSYQKPVTPARLVTEKEQFLYPDRLPFLAGIHWMTNGKREIGPCGAPWGRLMSSSGLQKDASSDDESSSLTRPELEPSFQKDLEPLNTTHDGFEKYLDPYLTTSRLHHRPHTADQLNKESNAPAKNIVTYYTFSNTPVTRTPKFKPEFWRLPLPSRPKSMYDRDKFKEGFREIRTHNKPNWVPGSFRTEVEDNFTSYMTKPEYKINNNKYEEEVQSMYTKALAALSPNTDAEYAATLQGYSTENSTVGSQRPLCSIFDPYPEKNKKLIMRENKTRKKECRT